VNGGWILGLFLRSAADFGVEPFPIRGTRPAPKIGMGLLEGNREECAHGAVEEFSGRYRFIPGGFQFFGRRRGPLRASTITGAVAFAPRAADEGFARIEPSSPPPAGRSRILRSCELARRAVH